MKNFDHYSNILNRLKIWFPKLGHNFSVSLWSTIYHCHHLVFPELGRILLEKFFFFTLSHRVIDCEWLKNHQNRRNDRDFFECRWQRHNVITTMLYVVSNEDKRYSSKFRYSLAWKWGRTLDSEPHSQSGHFIVYDAWIRNVFFVPYHCRKSSTFRIRRVNLRKKCLCHF